MKLAAESGDLEVVKWFAEVYAPGESAHDAAIAAAGRGHLNVLQWLVDVYGTKDLEETALKLAFAGRHAQVLEWISRRWKYRWFVVNAWAKCGALDDVVNRLSPPFLKWLVEMGWLPYQSVLACAARHNLMDFVQWFVGRLDRAYCDVKARHDRGDCICAYEEPNSRASASAAILKCASAIDCVGPLGFESGDFGIERYDDLYSSDDGTKGVRGLNSLFPYVLDLGSIVCEADLSILDWLRTADLPWFEIQTASDVMNQAITSGRYELVVWVHTHVSQVCSTQAMDQAAGNGDLQIVQFLHENKVDKNERLNMGGVLSGIRLGGCPAHAKNFSAGNGDLDVVRFLHENRPEGCSTEAMDFAAAYGHLDVVRFIHENRNEGCTTLAMDFAARNEHLDVVRFIHENRSEGCTTRAMDFAAAHGHLDVVRFLHENRIEGCTTQAVDFAAACGHLDVVRFLRENRTEGCATTLFLHENPTEGCTPEATQGAAPNS